jgi:hypothetical protein
MGLDYIQSPKGMLTLRDLDQNYFLLETDSAPVDLEKTYHVCAEVLKIPFEKLEQMLMENFWRYSGYVAQTNRTDSGNPTA